MTMQVQANVLVVHVQDTGRSSTTPNEWGQELITGVADDLSAFHLDVRTEVRRGPKSAFVSEVALAISNFDPQLVVLGSRRPSQLRLLFGGSVSAGVILEEPWQGAVAPFWLWPAMKTWTS
jgi:nucleotide-binding universal stress UspA family protein